MNKTNLAKKQKLVMAPLPSDPSIIPSIHSITINDSEEVKWQWLELPDGNRVVTNYQVISTLELKS